jgi:hypothetical protein
MVYLLLLPLLYLSHFHLAYLPSLLYSSIVLSLISTLYTSILLPLQPLSINLCSNIIPDPKCLFQTTLIPLRHPELPVYLHFLFDKKVARQPGIDHYTKL